MKNKILKYFLMGLIGSTSFALADAFSHQAIVDKYYFKFSHKTDGTGMLLRNGSFTNEVPLGERTEVLAEILDRASTEEPQNYVAIASVLELLAGGDFEGTKIIWNAHLEKMIYAQAKSPDWEVRDLFVMVLLHKQKDKARESILPLQNDPDDRVRSTVLNAITRWPGAEEIYQKYIQAHENDKDYTKSIWYAKANLDIVHRVQKGEVQ